MDNDRRAFPVMAPVKDPRAGGKRRARAGNDPVSPGAAPAGNDSAAAIATVEATSAPGAAPAGNDSAAAENIPTAVAVSVPGEAITRWRYPRPGQPNRCRRRMTRFPPGRRAKPTPSPPAFRPGSSPRVRGRRPRPRKIIGFRPAQPATATHLSPVDEFRDHPLEIPSRNRYLVHMTGDEFARLGYLSILGVAILAYFLIANRRAMGRLVRFAVLWGLIFVGVIAAAGLWDDVERNVTSRQAVFSDGDGRIEIPRSPDNHYYLMAHINGKPVRFVVDTGATEIVLTRADAERIGLNPDALIYTGQANTANGTVRTALVRLGQMEVGPISDSGVTAWVNEGSMQTSLLGMGYLGRFDRISIHDNTMVLER